MGWVVFFHIMMATIVAMVARSKGRSTFGFFIYGLLIWPIALVHILLAAPTDRAVKRRFESDGRVVCPFCSEHINPNASVCPFCRKDIDESASALKDHIGGAAIAANERIVAPSSTALKCSRQLQYAEPQFAAGRDKADAPKVPNLSREPEPVALQDGGKRADQKDQSSLSVIVPVIVLVIALLILSVWLSRVEDANHDHTAQLSEKHPLVGRGTIENSEIGGKKESVPETALNELVRETQRRLAALGFDPGPVDGVLGPKTRAAIRAFQQVEGIPTDGAVTNSLLERIRTKKYDGESAQISKEAICTAGISTVMGRDPSIMVIDDTRDDTIYLSYTRADDGTHWAYKCKVEGNRIIWGSKGGRWRTHQLDSKLSYKIRDSSIAVEDRHTDGSATQKTFSLRQLR